MQWAIGNSESPWIALKRKEGHSRKFSQQISIELVCDRKLYGRNNVFVFLVTWHALPSRGFKRTVHRELLNKPNLSKIHQYLAEIWCRHVIHVICAILAPKLYPD